MLVLFSALGVDLPKADTVFALRTVLVSLVIGTGITLIATILPARRATRVPPIAAVREGSTLPVSRFAAHTSKAGLGVVLGVRRRDLGRRVRRPGRRGHRAPARARGDRAVPRHRASGSAARRAAGPRRRLAGTPGRRGRGRARRGERAAQPPPHRLHRCGPDDRPHARDRGRRARRRHERLDQERGQRPAPRRLRRRRPGRRPVLGRPGRRGRRGVPGVTAASHVRADKALRRRRGDRRHRHRPGHDRPLLPLRLGGRVLGPGARTARSGRRAGDRELRRCARPRGRRPARAADALGRAADGRGARHLRPAARPRAALQREHRPGDVRRRVPEPEERVHVPRRRRRRRPDAGDAAARTPATRRCIPAPRTPRTRRRTRPRSWRCSTCCSASRSS